MKPWLTWGCLVVFLVAAAHAQSSGPAPTRLEIPKGKGITVDGAISAGEWDDARSMTIEVEPGWTVTVRYKHDASNLLFLFDGVHRPGTQGERAPSMFPEVVVDARNLKSAAWQPGQWWLHTSFNDCEGNGEFNAYVRDGRRMCAPEKPGWSANNWPLARPVVEMQISFAKLGVRTGAVFGLAVNVTNTSDAYRFWPPQAELARPATWGEAVLVP